MVAIHADTQSSGVRRTPAAAQSRLPIVVVLYVLTILLPISFPLGPLNMTGVRALLIVLFLPIVFNLLLGKYGRVLATDILFMLHMLWAAIALAVNNPDQAIQNAGSTGIEFIGGYMMGRAFIRSAEQFTALIRLLVTGGLLLLPVALLELPNGTAIMLQAIDKIPVINSIGDVENAPRMGLHRVQAVFAHPIHFGLFSIIVFSLCFLGLKDIYSTPRRWLTASAIAFAGMLSLSSGALLAVALQLMLIAWAWTFRKTRHRWTFLLALFVAMYVVIDLLSNRTPILVFLSYATFSAHTAYFRVAIFEWGMVNIRANPIFGIGLNDWVRLPWMYDPSVDNFWLLMGMRYGIPGFIFLAVAYVMALWKIGRLKFEEETRLWHLRRAWMFCFIGLTFILSTVHIWHNIYSFVFFIFGAGMWLLSATPDEVAETATPKASSGHYSRTKSVPRHVSHKSLQAPDTGMPEPDEETRYSRFVSQKKHSRSK